MHAEPRRHPEDWVEVRIRGECLRSRRRYRSYDVTIRLDQGTWATVTAMLARDSDFRQDYRDIRVERRTVRTVATDWEPLPDGELPVL